MTILLSDPRVAAVPIADNAERLVRLAGSPQVLVRAGLAERLARAATDLPPGLHLRVVEGYRSATAQQRIITGYTAQLRRLHPSLPDEEIERLASRFVSPLLVAPHVAGAAVDLTLVDDEGTELDLGTAIDATPEQSAGACYFDSPLVTGGARELRSVLRAVLEASGLVNYPTEWWHWSYGDRYWALSTGAPAALHGPLPAEAAA